MTYESASPASPGLWPIPTVTSLARDLDAARRDLAEALSVIETLRPAGSRQIAVMAVAALTPRQREIMASVLAGQASKHIAAELGISQRTVENHRASIMRKTGTRSLPALTRLALAAEPAA